VIRIATSFETIANLPSASRIMSQYTASVPSGGQVRPEIRTFFEEFYKVTDDPDAHERYIDM
jgi:hypothetical protein